jgi:uncharacterized protein
MYTNEELVSIAAEILEQYRLDPDGIHGVRHWGRVLENGAVLAERTSANIRIVQLFALFHDSRRLNDSLDPEHGRRGAELAGAMNGKLLTLSRDELALLQTACADHTRGFTEADVTVQTCWDADRLDLLRVSRSPDPRRLCTSAARDPGMIAWANERSGSDSATAFAADLIRRGRENRSEPWRERSGGDRENRPDDTAAGGHCSLGRSPIRC